MSNPSAVLQRVESGRAPRPWAPWQPGPVPRQYTGNAALERIGQQGYLRGVTQTWRNGWFAVMARLLETPWGTVTHLMVITRDGAPARDWPDLMRIKDELCGPERTAVEVFPPRDEVIDQANMTHLWVLPASMQLPFTLTIPDGVRALDTSEARS